MSAITIGTIAGTGKAAKLDLDVMMRTRLLVQASSGAGKSYLLRLLCERLYSHVPVIVIDVEGEFASLREKYDYVLAGKGGDTPADVRSAGLLATKLLELRASAVCDIFEMNPGERHRWVRLFLEAMIDAPKKLWRPVVVIVDEAHVFCPERGAGESEASEAMIALATRGRKRGFAAVWATQRLGKLRKDAAAELQNVLIGRTFQDIDRKRAAEQLGVSGKENLDAFHAAIKVLPPGRFFALGTALFLEQTEVQVGEVETSHAKAGSAKHAAEPPPAPAKIRALLPSLADLPAVAETKAATEADLRRDLAAVRRELAEAKRAVPAAAPAAPAKVVEKFVLKDGQLARAEKLIDRAERLAQTFGQLVRLPLNKILEDVSGVEEDLRVTAKEIRDAIAATRVPQPHPGATVASPRPGPRATQPAASPAGPVGSSEVGNGGLRRILIALAQRSEGLTLRQIGVRAGLSSKSGTFSTYMSRGRQQGWIQDGGKGGRSTITVAGAEALGSYDPLPTGRALFEYWVGELGESGAARILRALVDAHPDSLTLEQLGKRATLNHQSGTFSTYLSRLRTLELVESGRGWIQASDELFD